MVGAEAGSPEETRALLHRSFEGFEAQKAQCFKLEDRERLLGVIEAGFGELADFDMLVRHLLSQRRRRYSGVGERALNVADEPRDEQRGGPRLVRPDVPESGADRQVEDGATEVELQGGGGDEPEGGRI